MLWCVEYSVALINYAAPQNQHVGIIFGVNCPEDNLFTVVEFFNFQVHFPCKWEVLFWTKQRNKHVFNYTGSLKDYCNDDRILSELNTNRDFKNCGGNWIHQQFIMLWTVELVLA